LLSMLELSSHRQSPPWEPSQNGSLRLHHGNDLVKELEDARPSFEAVPAEFVFSQKMLA